jgi:hypothetical protein
MLQADRSNGDDLVSWAGSAALLVGMGLGVLLVGCAAGCADTHRAMQIMPSDPPVPSPGVNRG